MGSSGAKVITPGWGVTVWVGRALVLVDRVELRRFDRGGQEIPGGGADHGEADSWDDDPATSHGVPPTHDYSAGGRSHGVHVGAGAPRTSGRGNPCPGMARGP